MWNMMAGGKGFGTPFRFVPQYRPIFAAGGKAKQATSSFARKRKASSDEPVAPLDDDVEANILAYIQECGGSVTLGKLTSAFSGVKKKQLEQSQFALCQGDGDSVVSVPGTSEEQATQQIALAKQMLAAGIDPFASVAAGTEVQKAKKQRKEKEDPSVEPEPLSEQKINEITEYLMASNGQEVLGRLTSFFPGLKKGQLETHFVVIPEEKDSRVALKEGVPIRPAIKPPMLTWGEGVTSKTGTIKPLEGLPGSKRKKERREKDPNAPPPPQLEPEKVQEIVDWLTENASAAPLGKLATVFAGVKKAQLEMEPERFILVPAESENSDFLVRLA